MSMTPENTPPAGAPPAEEVKTTPEAAGGVSLDQLTPTARAELLSEFQEQQRRIAATAPTTVAGPPTPEQIAIDRQTQPFYCPGCGRTYGYQRECTGSGELPHPPLEVVSTDELAGPQGDHTPAPASG